MQVTANNISIEVEDSGGETRPALLLIMGLSMQLIDWPDEIIGRLVESGFRVVCYDNRDVGLSQKFDHAQSRSVVWQKIRHSLRLPVHAPYSVRDMADDALGVLDALNISQAHIIGASMGGMIGQWLAAMYPERVKSLVSIMSSSGARNLPSLGSDIFASILKKPASSDESDLIEHQLNLARIVSGPFHQLDEEALRQHLRIALRRSGYHPQGVLRQMLAIMADSQRPEILAKINCPTFVLHGDADPLINIACGEDTAKRITGAEFLPVHQMGHNFPPQFMQALTENVIPFLHGVK
ncbi:alpha/beta hydrolase [Xenorhabdus nematophila]|uniref:Alpha/beta hydrolase fold n=1 Tax=Xenorhabdus nematophila (strain ATCC 19061 / DSM 3370 / CCUG 14189 / LMG 1036 / NCIMB 9965 / AN6) TaxID=406817 RepID=D3VF31_XENNA|nr:alpha/beta hydrolase [Xenorhabdus nematophila]CEE90955.1 Alpha/beta hydrolase fold [Xenorhabdus nematophila str. Anatoliense]CBJ92488.1 Alpha/beta hydrolase fold [Xenorhabdus nematophila ATCC 19061]CCW31331.1 Alpha/beta hydrolase fold [Xenorhabdus nematophila F1]CEE91120.1 Alpha/beta hydrolase fold [Xenorhabdus nematophila str. Anatoliense]CEK25303.1 Alpha/beta hydrolase fold [Xenorhabdus nematophila AN6/1]